MSRWWRAVTRRNPAISQPRDRATRSSLAPVATSRDSSATRSNDTTPSRSSVARSGWSTNRRAVWVRVRAVSGVRSIREAAHSARVRDPSRRGTWARSRAWSAAICRARNRAIWVSSPISICSSRSMVVSAVIAAVSMTQTYRPGMTKTATQHHQTETSLRTVRRGRPPSPRRRLRQRRASPAMQHRRRERPRTGLTNPHNQARIDHSLRCKRPHDQRRVNPLTSPGSPPVSQKSGGELRRPFEWFRTMSPGKPKGDHPLRVAASGSAAPLPQCNTAGGRGQEPDSPFP